MKTRLPILFIMITLVIDAMGIGLIMPVMPDLIRELRGTNLASAAVWGGLLATSFAVMQFLFSPIIGSLSDRFGRRRVLLVSLFFMALDYLVMAVAGSIWILLAGRIVGGVTAATQSTATAYMADISTAKDKAKNFGLVSAAFGIGFVLGPLIGGFLSTFGPRAPFYAAAALAAANFVFGYFILPETVTNAIRRPFEWRRANPFGAFKSISHLPKLKALMLVHFLYSIAFFVYPAVWAYFTRERFGWDGLMVGYSLAAFGISIAVVQGGLIRVIIPRIGEAKTVLLGLALNMVAFLAMALITNGTIILLMTPLTALGAITGPALLSIMSRAADDNQQGELQGVLASVSSIGMILSPLLMTQTFSYFISPQAPVYMPGAPFLLSMGLIAICIGIYISPFKAKRRKNILP
ncbi:MFS transporter [Marinosulfonomonas sp. PRT-SC04]|nr:MFS transporter [Marinosulfonomonas sp. PRT-SC04]